MIFFEGVFAFAIAAGLSCLLRLAVVDLRDCLLPNEYVLGFAFAAALFHIASFFHFLNLSDMMAGAAIGGAGLYLVRAAAHYFYKTEALGLGDVKLMAAAGLLLGPSGILLALICGAGLGLLHGLAVHLRNKRREGFSGSLLAANIPAGPGFILGILAAGLFQFHSFEGIWQ